MKSLKVWANSVVNHYNKLNELRNFEGDDIEAGVQLCRFPEYTIHIYSGIDNLAKGLGVALKEEECDATTHRLFFYYKGYKFFQLKGCSDGK